VASVASRVRGYFVMFTHPIAPHRATDTSPVPLRLVKAPVAGHPLPKGEGKDPIPCHSPREMGKELEVRPPCPAENVAQAQSAEEGVGG
jgi:hypothetical protein